jgi:hypothetical protein
MIKWCRRPRVETPKARRFITTCAKSDDYSSMGYNISSAVADIGLVILTTGAGVIHPNLIFSRSHAEVENDELNRFRRSSRRSYSDRPHPGYNKRVGHRLHHYINQLRAFREHRRRSGTDGGCRFLPSPGWGITRGATWYPHPGDSRR